MTKSIINQEYNLFELIKKLDVMRVLGKIVIFSLFISTKICFASDQQTNNLENVKILLDKEADKETLVIFDVDDVLIAPTDEFAFRKPIRKKFNKELKLKYNQQERKILFSDFFRKRMVRLITPKIIPLLNDLKNKKIPTTALTRWYTGRYGSIELMEALRFKGLDEVGISFVNISPLKNDIAFPLLKTKDGIPMVKNGIILTAFADKGTTLLAVLDKEKLHFKKIIFIDDDLDQIASVKKACEKLGVNFIGIHYTQAQQIPLPKINKTIEKLRFKILEKEHIWLSDKELEKRKM